MEQGNEERLLRAILATVARQTFPPSELVAMVAPRKGMLKQIQAFNMCDGTNTQSQIAKITKLDSGNLSKSIKRWIDLGIVVRVVEDKVEKPIHVYPISEDLVIN